MMFRMGRLISMVRTVRLLNTCLDLFVLEQGLLPSATTMLYTAVLFLLLLSLLA